METREQSSYVPEKYWHHRGIDYKAPGEIQEAPEIEELQKSILMYGAYKNVLEIGAGYGRLFNILTKEGGHFKPDLYTMCDFVESMRFNCLRNTGVLPDLWDGNTLPYHDNQFDFVISFSVLLHVEPDSIERVIAEHARVCKKHLFIATYFGGLDQLAPHCFEHDYQAIFDKVGLNVLSMKTFQSGLRVNWMLSKSK